MIVFKTFLKVLNACKVPIILYTVMLIIFGGLNTNNSSNTTSFEASKPNILIINNDVNEGITKNLIEYIESNSDKAKEYVSDNDIKDALFYREIDYIIYIPKNYRTDYLSGLKPIIKVESTGDYEASLAEMMLNRYLKVADIYNHKLNNEKEIIKKTNSTLDKTIDIEMTTKLDVSGFSKATIFYNFANYSLIAGCVYVICLILFSFRQEKIKKRTIISSMNYKKYNRKLLLSNSLFALLFWLFYVMLSIIFVGDVMLTINGLLYMINSFIFIFSCLTFAFLIGNIISNKNAISGLVNVVSLGSSFLCGAFVPMEWLPDAVIKVAHIFPSYYYIYSNELIKKIEVVNFDTLKPIIINMIIMTIFTIAFVTITNIISKKTRKID